MKKTEHYQLNQWELTDRIMMEDFNADNARIEAALAEVVAEAGNCMIACGSYVGTGTYGKDKPNRIELDFKPLVFIPHCTDQGLNGEHLAWFHPKDNFDFRTNTSTNIYVTWEDTGLSWYASYSGSTNDESVYQFNKAAQTYYYIAIGIRA